MSSPDPSGDTVPETRHAWRHRLAGAGLAGWSLVVLGAFFATSMTLVEPLGAVAGRLTLAAMSLWVFHLAGCRVLDRLDRDDAMDPFERAAFELGIGVAISVAGLFVLGLFGLYSTWSVIVLMAAIVILCRPLAHARRLRDRWAKLPAGAGRFAWIVLATVGAMTLLESFAPPASQDALVYHLAIPDVYVRHGGIVPIAGNFFASFPQNVEMLFTQAILLGDASLAKFYHWLLGAASVLAIAALARRIGGGGGALAGLAFATIPTAALIATWAYVDLGLVLFQVLAVLAFLRWWRAGTATWLVLSGLFTGLAAGCKYTGASIGIVLGAAIVVVGALERSSFRMTLRHFGTFFVVSLAIAAPWYIKNAVITGNPLHPFLHDFLGGREWDDRRAFLLGRFLGEWGGQESWRDVLALPLRLTFSARFFSIERFDGLVGPLFLLAVPLAATARSRSREFWLVAAVGLGLAAIWVLTSRQIRFLLPALACFSALVGASAHLQRPGLPSRMATWCLRAGVVFNTLVIATHFAAHNPIPVVLGLESEHDYLAREVPGGDYEVFRHIDRELPASARILFAASGNPVFLCRREYHMDPIFENRTLRSVLRASDSAAGVRDELRRRGFTHLLFRGELVFGPAGEKSDLDYDEKVLLKDFLNSHASLAIQSGGTLLYAVEAESPAPESGGRR